jgi:hypothetical protein
VNIRSVDVHLPYVRQECRKVGNHKLVVESLVENVLIVIDYTAEAEKIDAMVHTVVVDVIHDIVVTLINVAPYNQFKPPRFHPSFT